MLLRDRKSGLWVRPGTYDREVIKEQRRAYGPMDLTPDDVVLDLGGHIGSFACMVAAACRVHSYEPHPGNYAVLTKQREAGLGPERWMCTRAAVGPADARQVDFYVNLKKNTGAHSLRPTRGRDVIQVDVTSFTGTALRPIDKQPLTAIKCDIEGGEYDLDWALVPATVRVIAMELHLQPQGWRAKGKALAGAFRDSGWTAVREPKVWAGAYWHTVAVWHR